MTIGRAAVFLDRDGVIIEDREDYVKSWDEITFIPSAFTAIRDLTEAGIPVVMVTNQAAVGRSIVSAEFVEETHSRMRSEIAKQGGRIAGVYYCPHHPDADCDCRKPKPGMLLQASRDLDLDLTESIMVGDSIRDIASAEAAGSRGILVLTGKGRTEAARLNTGVDTYATPIAIVDDIGAATQLILEMAKS